MHNMSGNYDNSLNPRKAVEKSCGRPFAPELTVRAGGEPGRLGAVTACCQTLGPRMSRKVLWDTLIIEFRRSVLWRTISKFKKNSQKKNLRSWTIVRIAIFI